VSGNVSKRHLGQHGFSEPIKLLYHFESGQVYDFWLNQPEIINLTLPVQTSVSAYGKGAGQVA
jgi:hypothetical protein